MSGIVGLISVSAAASGASEVISLYDTTEGDSTTRITIATPTSGKRIRFISAMFSHSNAIACAGALYFGTGGDEGTNPASIIHRAYLDLDTFFNHGMSWPDGAGPIGAVDAVVSLDTDVNVGGSLRVIVHYREE